MRLTPLDVPRDHDQTSSPVGTIDPAVLTPDAAGGFQGAPTATVS